VESMNSLIEVQTPQRGGIPSVGGLYAPSDDREPPKVWAFEERTYTGYGTSGTFTFGRLRRRALLTSNLSNLTGRYGYTVDWNTDETINQIVDTLGRQLTFSYRPVIDGTVVLSRTVSQVKYKQNAGDPLSPVITVLELQGIVASGLLERITKTQTAGYTRFLYAPDQSGVCRYCSSLISDVIIPGTDPTSTPAISSPPLATEVVFEHNEYTGTPAGIMTGARSRYPGREYAYLYELDQTTQCDLHQPAHHPELQPPTMQLSM
jgi:hypothetical protein